MRCWQDLAKTVPAVNDGDPVAVAENDFGPDLVQPDPLQRPTLRGGLPSLGDAHDHGSSAARYVSREVTSEPDGGAE